MAENNHQPTNQTTLDDLAVAIANGFHGVDEKFHGIDDKFHGIDEKFDQVFRRLDNLESDAKRARTDLAAIRFTLTELAYKDEVRATEIRLDRIEKHLGLAPAE